ncbi:hypothetical protein UFOVP244_144 [uncultured Caudovirales phage]|uniref:Uncharacterized protein n=1 Tax=uncultured Caudovirales phage TaxID=2100421 RepID=A0A6J7WUD7_9CAUD|nr:hypothetical protein UFOVP244_144 [uncultured Caudovirales phage]
MQERNRKLQDRFEGVSRASAIYATAQSILETSTKAEDEFERKVLRSVAKALIKMRLGLPEGKISVANLP